MKRVREVGKGRTRPERGGEDERVGGRIKRVREKWEREEKAREERDRERTRGKGEESEREVGK